MWRADPRLAVAAMSLVLASAAVSAAAPPVPFTPATAADLDLELLPAGSPGAATALAVTTSCDPERPRTPVVAMVWLGGDGATAHRVDVTMFKAGFAAGRFEVSPPLPATATAVALVGAEAGLTYRWRVLSATDDGWVVSEVGRFDVPTCVWDEPPAWQE